MDRARMVQLLYLIREMSNIVCCDDLTVISAWVEGKLISTNDASVFREMIKSENYESFLSFVDELNGAG